MKQFIIIAVMIFASMTVVAQNGNSTVALNNSNQQTTEQTTTKEAEAQKEIESKEKQEEVSIFDNNILHPSVAVKAEKNKGDK